ncbi:MAG: hypothetical protein IJK98_00910, partial [Clostridia bacterium]|nr:hypothetical protein [Clostridia bacterium]
MSNEVADYATLFKNLAFCPTIKRILTFDCLLPGTIRKYLPRRSKKLLLLPRKESKMFSYCSTNQYLKISACL